MNNRIRAVVLSSVCLSALVACTGSGSSSSSSGSASGGAASSSLGGNSGAGTSSPASSRAPSSDPASSSSVSNSASSTSWGSSASAGSSSAAVSAVASSSGTASSSATVVTSTVTCTQAGIRRLHVPALWSAPQGTQLEHAYRFFASPRANAPTVVVVPGGPGGAIMSKSPSDAFALGAVPLSQFNIIYTDARGSGCNAYPQLAEADAQVFTVENTARDVLAVVRHAGLTDYLFYGASYGTAQVTVAASLAQATGTPLPRRLVLEGVLGRAFDSFESYFAAFRTEWLRVKPMLSAAWQTEFNAEPWSATLYWSREQWGAFISQQLILGEIPRDRHLLVYWLDGLSAQDPAAQAYVGGFMSGVAATGPPGALFTSVACRQLWGDWKQGREIRNGLLNATGPDICNGTGLEDAFDSAAWPVAVPITAMHGPFDPTTTTAQVQYHLEHHPQVHRQLVTVPGASHAPLTLGLAGRGCATQVWQKLDAAPQELAQALALCTTGAETPVGLVDMPAQ